MITLKEVVFANMLNEMRLGKITDDTVCAFRRLSRPIKYEDSLDATELHVFPVLMRLHLTMLIVTQISDQK